MKTLFITHNGKFQFIGPFKGVLSRNTTKREGCSGVSIPRSFRRFLKQSHKLKRLPKKRWIRKLLRGKGGNFGRWFGNQTITLDFNKLGHVCIVPVDLMRSSAPFLFGKFNPMMFVVNQTPSDLIQFMPRKDWVGLWMEQVHFMARHSLPSHTETARELWTMPEFEAVPDKEFYSMSHLKSYPAELVSHFFPKKKKEE